MRKSIQLSIQPLSALLGAGFLGGAITLCSMAPQQQGNPRQIYRLTAEQAEILSHMSIVYLDDGAGNEVNKTVRVSGVNVQVVNGMGATDTSTGTGNLIVGYNELGNSVVDDRTGSHYFVGGEGNSYTSYGGLILGSDNFVSGALSMVAGGGGNQAEGPASCIVGGSDNSTTGPRSVVVGGNSNTSAGPGSVVLGGLQNVTTGQHSAVLGGTMNQAGGDRAAVAGGDQNVASGNDSSVLGGLLNEASGAHAAVAGGEMNTADGENSVVSGGLNRHTFGMLNWWAAGGIVQAP